MRWFLLVLAAVGLGAWLALGTDDEPIVPTRMVPIAREPAEATHDAVSASTAPRPAAQAPSLALPEQAANGRSAERSASARLRGRLLGLSETTIVEARLRLLRPDTRAVAFAVETTTNPFVVDDVPAGPFVLWAGAPGHGWQSFGALQVVAGAVLDVGDLVLRTVEPCTFVVTDEQDGPIARANVRVLEGPDLVLAAGETDASGAVQLDGVPRGKSFTVAAAGFWSDEGIVTGHEQRCTLRRAPMLAGTVFGAEGLPLRSARAVLLAPVVGRRTAPPLLPPACAVAHSDEAGRFTLPFPHAATCDLVVDAPAHGPVVVQVRAADLSHAVIVRLPAGASVNGTARNADEAPLAHKRVEVWSLGPQQQRTGIATLGPTLPWAGGQLLALAISDAEGSFTIRDLPAGAAVVALGPDDGCAAANVLLQPGGTATVSLQTSPPGAVHVRVAGEAPVEVFLYGGPTLVRTIAVTTGTFHFANVPPGRYLVGASTPPLAAHLHAVVQQFVVHGRTALANTIDVGPAQHCTVDLAAPTAATGRVIGQATIGRVAAAGFLIVLVPSTGHGANRRQTRVAADGSFAIDGLAAGDYDAQLQRPGEPQPLATVRCRVVIGSAVEILLTAP